jgi:hypothetical protein
MTLPSSVVFAFQEFGSGGKVEKSACDKQKPFGEAHQEVLLWPFQ